MTYDGFSIVGLEESRMPAGRAADGGESIDLGPEGEEKDRQRRARRHVARAPRLVCLSLGGRGGRLWSGSPFKNDRAPPS